MKTTLRKYQQDILNELANEKAIALFMRTGSGKTITSLAKVEQNGTNKLLVICPKSVIGQWEEVISREQPKRRIIKFKKSHSANGKNNVLREQSENYDTVIVNFEIVHNLTYLIEAINNDWTIIVDESHRIKSLNTTVTKAVVLLGRLTEYKIILTATPHQGLYGGYIDYLPQLQFLGHFIGKSKSWFMKEFCITQEVSYMTSPYPIKLIVGYKNLEPIKDILSRVSRKYEPKLGDYSEPEHIRIRIEKPASYNRLVRQRAYILIAITNLMRKRVALKTLTGGRVHGQTVDGTTIEYDDNEEKITWLKEFLEGVDSSVVIFYQYNAELKMIRELLDKLGKTYVTINGDTTDKLAEVAKNVEVYVGQYQAMSESIDGLQYQSHITVFYSLPESSITYRQALGRTDRLGQKYQPIYYYLVMEDTVDSDIYELIEKKVEFNENDLERIIT